MIHYLGVVLSQDPRECLMPFAANAMKMAEKIEVSPAAAKAPKKNARKSKNTDESSAV